MALAILDGTQTATTLSTILSSGQHITAHTVVSLGAQAVTDISTAVGLLQSAVATQGSVANTAFVKIGGHTGSATTGNIVHVSSVGAMKVDASASTQPISGTVTANLNLPSFAGGNGDNLTSAVQIGYYDADSGEFRKVDSQYNPLPISGTVTVGNTVTIAGTVTANPTGTQTIAGSVTIGAGTAQIGSVTASISNTVVTVYSAQGTTVSNTNFTSTTASTSLVSAVAGREVLTVFNEGAGNLHISPSATCTTISYQVRLSTGDYWECPQGQLSLAHTAVFATAGTARVTEVS